VRFLLSGKETGEKYSLTEFTSAPPPAPGPPIHIHKAEDELNYILDGDFKFTLRETTVAAPKGSFVFVPKGTPHTVANAGPREATLLVILTPPGFEQYWAEMAKLLASTGGKPGPDRVLALQEKYNLDTGGKARQFIGD
jgi:quercetin dioxygenase-like cupin family protein